MYVVYQIDLTKSIALQTDNWDDAYSHFEYLMKDNISCELWNTISQGGVRLAKFDAVA